MNTKLVEERIIGTLDFIGMLGFSPNPVNRLSLVKWLRSEYKIIYLDGKADGLKLARDIMNSEKDNPESVNK